MSDQTPERIEEAATAVVEWWRPANARTRSFEKWFGEVLPDLREALGLPRSMADEAVPGADHGSEGMSEKPKPWPWDVPAPPESKQSSTGSEE